MRIIGLSLTGMAIAVVGMLAVGVADPAFAATKNANWRNTPIPNQSAQFYRSSSQTHKPKSRTAKTNN